METHRGLSWPLTVLAIALLPAVLAAREPDTRLPEAADTPQAADTLQGAASDTAAADTVAADTAPSAPARAHAALVRMDAALDSIVALAAETRGAADEQRELARVKAYRYIEEIQDLQAELLGLMPELEAAGLPADSIRNAFAPVFLREADLYDEAIEGYTERIDDLRDMRSSTPPEELGALEVRIQESKARLDTLLIEQVENLSGADSLGLDMSEAWEFLDRFLANWAESQVGRLQIATLDRRRLRTQIRDAQRAGAVESEIVALRARLQAAEQRILGIAASLDGIANLLARRGFETAQYRQIVIRATGDVTADILNPKVLLGLLREIATDLGRWLRDKGPTILVRLLIIIGIIILFRIGFRLTWWLFRILRLVKLSQLLTNLVGGLVRPTATLAGLVTGLWIVGLNPTALLAGLGVAGIIVGLALQDSLSNFAAGFFILTNRPYDVDDVIEAGGVVGTVQTMGLASTTIMTFDNRRLFVPNRKIWSDVIENRSAEPVRRVEVTVKISYREDLDRALGVLRNILDVNEKVLEDPEPVIFISKLADSWIEVAIWPWTKNEHWLHLLRELPRLVRLRFEEEGIEVPYPTREIVADRSKDMPPTDPPG